MNLVEFLLSKWPFRDVEVGNSPASCSCRAYHSRERSSPSVNVLHRLKHVGAEMSLHMLAYNLRRVINILGVDKLMRSIRMLAAYGQADSIV